MSLFSPIIKLVKRSDRVGRGISAGQGKTAGRGTKGQKSRTGYNLPRRFEGGQTSLIARLPKKKGFQSKAPKIITISTTRLNAFPENSIITSKVLFEKGLIESPRYKVKIVLGSNKKSYRFRGVNFSKSVKPAHTQTPKKAKQA